MRREGPHEEDASAAIAAAMRNHRGPHAAEAPRRFVIEVKSGGATPTRP